MLFEVEWPFAVDGDIKSAWRDNILARAGEATTREDWKAVRAANPRNPAHFDIVEGGRWYQTVLVSKRWQASE